MNAMKSSLICLAGVLFSVPMIVRAADAPLQERMSYAEFRKLGLDQLSEQQIKGLNAWLQAHGDCGASMSEAARPSAGSVASKATPAAQDTQSDHIQSRIAGDFSGWSNDTVLTLQNGQRWRVTDDESMHIATLHDPQVTLWKGLFNAWLLSVDGLDQTAHVARVR